MTVLLGRDPACAGEDPGGHRAEDEPADVGEERDAPPFAEALNSPKFASISWYKNHSPR